MARRRHTPDQITRKVAEGNKLLAGGAEFDKSMLREIAEDAPIDQLVRVRAA